MKRTYTLIVLLGLVLGALVTGCNQSSDTTTGGTTNATPSTTTTNK